MLDISNIPGELISQLAGAYLHANWMFGVEPVDASEKKQRKIRKWFSKQYAEEMQDLPEEVKTFLQEKSNIEVLLLLKECLNLEQSLEQQKDDELESTISVFDEETKSAIKELLTLVVWPETQRIGKDLQIAVHDTPAYRKVLTLCNVENLPETFRGDYCNDLGMYRRKEDGRFCFYGELEDDLFESTEAFALTFEDAQVEIAVYNACSNALMEENPWDFLRSICFNIGCKAELPGDCFNEKERNLMPLIQEICGLCYWLKMPEAEYQSFRQLKAMTAQYGYQKAVALLENLETTKPGEDKYNKTVHKLITYLCGKKCQPLWWEIYNQISDSQSSYPDKAEAFGDQERLANIRNTIQTGLEAKGYTGTYPDFVKTGPMKGIHLENSYNMTYWVGMEKWVQYHIHCAESFNDYGEFFVQFLCGTAFLKKEEEETDIYDCLFNANGRRLFHVEDSEPTSLNAFIDIAVKRAECRKLNKTERELIFGPPLFGWGTFLWIFLLGGGLFSVAMTLAMMLMCIIFTAVVGLAADIPEMLAEMPWGQILAISWIGFGGAMGIVEVLAHRK